MKTNQVLLIGYVGKDPQTTQTTKGSKRICIRMATHYRRSNTAGEPSFQTVWHNVVAWDQKAEYAERNFIKGSKILVEGVIDYRNYPDKLGHTRYVTEIRANSLLNLDR